MLNVNDKIGIVACSNALPIQAKNSIHELEKILKRHQLEPVFSQYIYQTKGSMSGTGQQKAMALMNFYMDQDIKAIFDISGGDKANEVLSYLDFDIIKENPKPFFGYSDLTTIINAIYTKTNQPAYLYQLKNLIKENKVDQQKDFFSTMLKGTNDLMEIPWTFHQGSSLSGIVVGGNIRCFLKLAGTPFFPDLQDKVLFLESFGGEAPQMITYFHQLKQMGAFNKISGLLLGTFTKFEENKQSDIVKLIQPIIHNPNLPIAKTNRVGHHSDSKCLIIGEELHMNM